MLKYKVINEGATQVWSTKELVLRNRDITLDESEIYLNPTDSIVEDDYMLYVDIDKAIKMFDKHINNKTDVLATCLDTCTVYSPSHRGPFTLGTCHVPFCPRTFVCDAYPLQDHSHLTPFSQFKQWWAPSLPSGLCSKASLQGLHLFPCILCSAPFVSFIALFCFFFIYVFLWLYQVSVSACEI